MEESSVTQQYLFERFLKETMSRLISADCSKYKKIVKNVSKLSFDHVFIGWSKLRPEMFQPKTFVLNVKNEKILHEGNEMLRKMDIFTDPQNLIVVQWSTEYDFYQSLDTPTKKICDILKKFVNKNKCAIIIHRDPVNPCQNLSVMPHLHLIVKREGKKTKYDGHLMEIGKKLSNENGLMIINEVLSLFGLIGKMLVKPRLYLGSNDLLLKEAVEGVSLGKISFLPVKESDCLGRNEEMKCLYDERLKEYNWPDVRDQEKVGKNSSVTADGVADVKDDESIYGLPGPSKPRRLVDDDDDDESPSSAKSDGFQHFTRKMKKQQVS